jgi:2-oxoglutarate ferredoxin oxidoreductase subunit beta
MSYYKPKFSHPLLPTNNVGYKKVDYEGVISTLCAGCGHDSITGAIVEACFELDVEPHKLAKISGIGCSSKTPTYFLSNSHGFNSLHGRMPSITTGANLANKHLTYLGVSGDGDTASIGMGQFVHAIRRNLNMTYIVMNNGCYGLTKGQDSATADYGSINKSGHANNFESIDLAGLALELGAGFVARSFSGDKPQLITLIKAALSHPGFAFIDVISPCVTFNNNKGSTKSYSHVREYMEITSMIDFVPIEDEIIVEYEEGKNIEVDLHGGHKIRLSKPAKDWDPYNRVQTISRLMKAKEDNEILTGLLYIEQNTEDLHKKINSTDIPLNKLKEKDLCPGNKILQEINSNYR